VRPLGHLGEAKGMGETPRGWDNTPNSNSRELHAIGQNNEGYRPGGKRDESRRGRGTGNRKHCRPRSCDPRYTAARNSVEKRDQGNRLNP